MDLSNPNEAPKIHGKKTHPTRQCHSADTEQSVFSVVLDLPQIYTRPSPDVLLRTLTELAIKPVSWDVGANGESLAGDTRFNEEGIPKYLTSIVASRLAWIEDEDVREQIWELASLRLSERSGRTGNYI